MSGLELNKIAAAILVAGLLAMVVSKVTHILYQPELKPAERGYTIAGAENADAPVAAAEEKPVDIAIYLASADATKGEQLAKPCMTCHTFGQGEANKTGPNLWGIVGAKHAHKEDFSYSKAMQEHPGTWGYQELSEFLTKPAKYIPGTKMSFAGIKKPEDRAHVLAYLQSMSSSKVPFPAPKEAPAEEKPADAKDDAEKAKDSDKKDAADKKPDAKKK